MAQQNKRIRLPDQQRHKTIKHFVRKAIICEYRSHNICEHQALNAL